MIKIAMINISREISENKMKSRMIMQVHDELVFEVHEDELDKMKLIVKEKMESAIQLNVPVVVEIGTGTNWEEAH